MKNILKLYNILTYYEKDCRSLLNSTDFLLQSGEAPDRLLTESITSASIKTLSGGWKLQGRHCHLGDIYAAAVNHGVL